MIIRAAEPRIVRLASQGLGDMAGTGGGGGYGFFSLVVAFVSGYVVCNLFGDAIREVGQFGVSRVASEARKRREAIP